MSLQNARRIGVLLPDDQSAANWTLAGTGASRVLSNDNRTVAFTNTAGNTSGDVATVNFKKDKWYVPSVTPTDIAADMGATVGILKNGVAPSSGASFITVATADNNKRKGWKFKAAQDEETTITFGTVGGGAPARTNTFKDFTLYEYDEEPANFDSYYPLTDINAERFPWNFYTKFEAAGTVSSNTITEIKPHVARKLWHGAIVHFVGDSQSAGTQGGYTYPNYAKSVEELSEYRVNKVGVINDHIAGATLVDIANNIDGYLKGGRYPPLMVADMWTTPTAGCIEGGGNDSINEVATITAQGVVDRYDPIINSYRRHGIRPLMLCNITPIGADASSTEAMITLVDSVNALLGAKYRNIPVLHVFDTLRGDVNTKDLADTTIASPDTREAVEGVNADYQRNPPTVDVLHYSDLADTVIGHKVDGIINSLFTIPSNGFVRDMVA